jgi:negative regulator of flagellin synthesis FlgM
MRGPDYDEQRVEQIKQAIRDGNYPIDARRIAESFAALEKLI